MFKYEGKQINEWYLIKGLGNSKYLARCSCGTEKIVYISNLTTGKSTNCGCVQKETNRKRLSTHGDTKTKLYRVWRGMINRCKDKNVKCYCNYGGRGISMCQEWEHDYLSFKKWSLEHGYKEGLELDRIDNNGNYEPSNCRFVTRTQNARNKRSNHIVTINGISKAEIEWEEEYNLSPGRIIERINLGWKEKDLLNPISEDRNGRFKAYEIELFGEKLTFKEISEKYNISAATIGKRYKKGLRENELIKPSRNKNKKG